MANIPGVDYSFARPSPTTIYQDGYRFVCRYIAHSASKVLTVAEANSLFAAGLNIVLVFEDNADPTTNDPSLSPHDNGVADASFAFFYYQNILGLNIASGIPIYFAVDVRPWVGSNTTPNPNFVDYFQGVWDYIGDNTLVGVYSGDQLFDTCDLAGYSTWFWQAAATSWSDIYPSPSAQIIQTTAGTGIPGTDYDYVPSGTTQYGQWTSVTPPPPTYGTLTIPSSVNFNSAGFAQPQLQAYQSTILHDRVIYSNTFNLTVTNPYGSSFTTLGPYSTDINQSAYPMGNFSYDNGLSYNDFGFIFGSDTSSPDYGQFPGSLPPVVIQPAIDTSGDIYFNVAINEFNHTISPDPIPLIINIALLATYQPSIMPNAPSLTQSIAYSSSQPASPNQYATYRRIASGLDSSVSSGTYIIPHNLSSIPNLIFWNQDNTNQIFINPTVYSSNGEISGDFSLIMDNTSIYIYNPSPVTNTFYRVFEDN